MPFNWKWFGFFKLDKFKDFVCFFQPKKIHPFFPASCIGRKPWGVFKDDFFLKQVAVDGGDQT